MALVPYVRDQIPNIPTGLNIDELTGACSVFERFFMRVQSSDIYDATDIVDKLWTRGSGIDVSLIGDPYLYELAVQLALENPTLVYKKPELRDSLLARHKARPCLFHLGTAFAVAGTVAERILKLTTKYKFLKANPQRASAIQSLIENAPPQNGYIDHVLSLMHIESKKPAAMPAAKLTPLEDLEMWLNDASPRTKCDDSSPILEEAVSPSLAPGKSCDITPMKSCVPCVNRPPGLLVGISRKKPMVLDLTLDDLSLINI